MEEAMKILVGYVPTPEGEAALDRAILEARLRDAELVVVHSQHGGERDETERSIAQEAKLAVVRRRLEAEGVWHSVRALVRGKDPGEDLLEFRARERRWAVPNPCAYPWRVEAVAAMRRLGRVEEARELASEQAELGERWGTARALALGRFALGLVAPDRERSGEHFAAASEDEIDAGAIASWAAISFVPAALPDRSRS
jgi:nucleotide-binding universal stress UspA family protein